MPRKTTKIYLQEIIDIMDNNNLLYIELQHPQLGLVKLSKNPENTETEPTIQPREYIEPKNDFSLTDEDFLFASA